MKLTPFPGPIQRNPRYGKIVLSDEQQSWLRTFYPVIENPRLIKVSGLTHSVLHRFAREFGLSKSEEGLKAIKRRQAIHIKRVCEKNGYYDSLRGKKPSQKCLDAYKDYLHSDRYEHPLKKMKRERPRAYAARMKKKGRERKELIRMERCRDHYGLERKTKLNIPMQPFSRRQVGHRYNALRRGYLLAADCSEGTGERYIIYFNRSTQRSPMFERNCINDGFTFKEYNNENA